MQRVFWFLSSPTHWRVLSFLGLAGLIFLNGLLAGCAIVPVRRAQETSLHARPGRVLVFGKVNYVIDGEEKLPYGLFRPRWPAPILNATEVHSGAALHSPAVGREDGSFLWELPPGQYVISRIGVGQFTDETYIAWPRIAFQVPSDVNLVYLGHLRLVGTTTTNEMTLTTGRVSRVVAVRYTFDVKDELDRHVQRFPAALVQRTRPVRSLMFQDPKMPIGDRFVEMWRLSPTQLGRRIFGRAQ